MAERRITIGSLTGHIFTPSSRFRVRQLILPLQARGIDLVDFPRRYSSENLHAFLPHLRIRESFLKMGYAAVQEVANILQSAGRLYSMSDFDYSFISREIMVGYPSFEWMVPNKIIYDIDDAIFLYGPHNESKTRRLVEAAKVIFAGNEYLADWCRAYSVNVHLLPTAVDTSRFSPALARNAGPFVVGWSGTSTAFKYLVAIEDQLIHFFETHDDAIFTVCSDRYPTELSKLEKYLRFEQWTEENEVRQIQDFSVGIMPVDRDEWALGKCSYKMLLYLSCAVPCCVTAWGMNAEILGQGRVGLGVDSGREWCELLDDMYKSRFELQARFPDCRAVVERHYSLPSVANSFAWALEQ